MVRPLLGARGNTGSCLICFHLRSSVVPAAVYGLHFPFSAFNTLWVFLLPDRVLSPYVCQSVGVRSFVDLAGRPQAGAPPVVKPIPSPSSEGDVNEEEGGCGRLLRFPEKGSRRRESY